MAFLYHIVYLLDTNIMIIYKKQLEVYEKNKYISNLLFFNGGTS
jgi:hypothetical protein